MRLSNLNETPLSFGLEKEAPAKGLEWFAIQVKCRYEERIASILVDKSFEAFPATSKTAFKTRKAGYSESRALFPGYIFSRFDVRYRMPILVTPGVQAIVGCGKVPIPVDDNEIAAIRQVLESGVPVEPCPYLEIGDPVEVNEGPLTGMRGIVLQQRSSCRVVLSVALIQRSIRVEVPPHAVIPLNRERCPVFPDRSRGGAAVNSCVL
ncbi:MAG TPA: transcription termination/antitermination NusG family protein [Bryobacteraceae bacterium]|nr:transcription termination/antitermination NusG family protein [Bryobacteraceae bacterium]